MNPNSSPTVGKLYLVPAPLDFGCEEHGPLDQSMPMDTLRAAACLQHWICENAKSTRAYLKRIAQITPLKGVLQSLDLQELPREVHKKGDHHGEFDARYLLQAALAGHDIGLVSEAGMPAIADPGASVVRAAHDLGIEVVALVGPVSLILALAASGLNGQNFAFVGYVPATPSERAQRIKELENHILKTGQTQILIETPYRNQALLQTLLQTLQPTTRLASASGLTLSSACHHSGSVKHWRQSAWAVDNKIPTVFCIGR